MGEFRMPSVGADMEAGTLISWLVKVGDTVHRGDLMAEIETDKGLVEVEVFEDGVVEKLLLEPGQRVPVDTVLAVIASAPPSRSTTSAQAPPPATEPRDPVRPEEPPRRGLISPRARRLAAEKGVDVAKVVGSGPHGAIEAADIEQAAAQQAARAKLPIVAGPQATALAPPDGMRRAIAAAMSRSNREIPHYYLKTRIDLQRALQWMQARNATLPLAQRLLPVALLARAAVLALAEVPELNGFWVDDQFRPQSSVHLGFAVGLKKGGLLVPALRDAEKKNLDELMAALADLIERARRGRLHSSELGEATITLTSLGDRGVEEVFGVIYPPQVALIGLGVIRDQPWAVEGMLGVRPVVCATLAGDHRATDGRQGARFLEVLERLLQEPEKL